MSRGVSDLPEVMKQTAGEMTASLAKLRAAMDHNLSKGEAAEEALRKFLRGHLPQSLGIAKGQIIDSKGHQSKQLDVIIYDAQRTPILFSSEENAMQVVPSEGVIAVVEVKTSINTSDVAGIIANMTSVKNLDKTAFYDTDHVITHTVNVYGRELKVFPTLYFVFAFESSPAPSLVRKFIALMEALPLDQRVDCCCLLDQGVILNQGVDGMHDAVPSPGSRVCAYSTSHALFLWYLIMSRWLLQAKMRPVNLLPYVPPGFAF